MFAWKGNQSGATTSVAFAPSKNLTKTLSITGSSALTRRSRHALKTEPTPWKRSSMAKSQTAVGSVRQ